MWKKLGLGVAILLLVMAAALSYLVGHIGHTIQAAIEKNGSAATSTKVAVGSVALSLISGKCVITGLTVGNPPGFSMPYAITLGTITIHAELASLFRHGPLIVDRVTIDRPHIYYEIGGGAQGLSLKSLDPASGSNLGTLQRDAKAKRPDRGPMGKEIIRELNVTHGLISISAAVLDGQKLTENLPAIQLSDIGEREGGVTTGQVSAQVLTAITNQAALTGAASLVKAVGSAATLPLDNSLTKKLKSIF